MSEGSIMRRLIAAIVLIVLVLLLVAAVNQFAPQLTAIREAAEPGEEAVACLTDATGACLQMPAVTGVDINNQEISFPQAFSNSYYLVVMPYDRQQQEGALTWLQLFQALAAEYEALSYFSIAALPDLSAPIRLLVVGGLAAGVREDAVRSQVAVLFLEDQAAFLEAVGAPNAEEMSAFIMDGSGRIYWQWRGLYSEAAAEDLRTALSGLLR